LAQIPRLAAYVREQDLDEGMLAVERGPSLVRRGDNPMDHRSPLSTQSISMLDNIDTDMGIRGSNSEPQGEMSWHENRREHQTSG
jgi:hypothetical protein